MPRQPQFRPGRPTGQYTQAVRLFRLYFALVATPDGRTLDALAAELGVTTRSIRRDLDALARADVPGVAIESVERSAGRCWRLHRPDAPDAPATAERCPGRGGCDAPPAAVRPHDKGARGGDDVLAVVPTASGAGGRVPQSAGGGRF